jgi:phage tail sheath protein FI
MVLDLGVSYSYESQSAFDVAASSNNTPVFLIGFAPNAVEADFPLDTLVLIDSPTKAEQVFGANLTDNDFVLPVEILHRNGCRFIVCVRVEKGVDEATDLTNIIGTDQPRTGLNLLKSFYSEYGEYPIVFAICNEVVGTDDTILTDILAIANDANSSYVFNFAEGTLVTDAVTTRQTDAGFGTKDYRLIPCYGTLYHTDTPAKKEPLKYHLMAAFASVFEDNPGWSPGGQLAAGVDKIVETMVLSTTDENSDNEKLTDEGVVCPNRITIPVEDITGTVAKNSIVTWGTRNGAYPDDQTQFSYLQALPFRDAIKGVLDARSTLFLHRPCDVANGRAIERSCNNILGEWDVKTKLLESRSDFVNNYLEFNVLYSINNVTERLHFNITLVVDQGR